MKILISVLAVLAVCTMSQVFAADTNTLAPAADIIEVNSVTPAVDPNAVVATVNGTQITEGQIEKMLAIRMKQMAGRVPENMMPQYIKQMRKQAIEQMVIEAVLTEKEKEKNITVSEEELTTQINKQMAQQNLTMDDFKAMLKGYGVDFSEYQQNMKKRAMFEKLMETEFADKVKAPTDEQVRAYYDENAQQFTIPESIHAKHILIRPADGNDPNQAKLQAKAKAQELLAKVKGGAEFETVAKENSACPSAKNGGDLGSQQRGTFVPEFEKAAYALKPGEISDVVETQFGYHIIKLIERSDANTVSFENAKENIVQMLGDKQKEQIVMDYIQKIKAEADVKFTNEADKFEINAPKPTAEAPARKTDEKKEVDANAPKPATEAVIPGTAEEVDANAPKPATEVVKENSDKKTDKKADKKADKKVKNKADKKVKKKADKNWF